MAYGLSAPVLVLNRGFQAIRVTNARHALEMLYMGRALALDRDYETHDFVAWSTRGVDRVEEWIGTTAGPLGIPRLMVLTTYDRVPRTPVRLSRRNVFLRDAYTCQYCGRQPHVRDLNLDHVIPRCRGGRSTWDNLVTSCRDCNLQKGRDLPAECGMTLRSEPARPDWAVGVQLGATPRRFREWEPFLGTRADAAE